MGGGGQSQPTTTTVNQQTVADPATIAFRQQVAPLLTAEASRAPNVYGATWNPTGGANGTGGYDRNGQPLTAGSNQFIDSYLGSAGGGTGQANWGLGQAGGTYNAARDNAFNIANAGTSDFNAASGNFDAAAAGRSGQAGQGQFGQASDLYGRAAAADTSGQYQQFGAQARGLYGASTNPTGLAAASPYLQAAGQSSASNVNDYMNPYNQNVTDRIASLGARNLSENLLPKISSDFVRSGGYGGTEQRDLIGRALRDTNESILGQQAQVLQSGYGQGLQAAQGDLSRYGQLAGTAGGLGTQQQQLLQGAASGISGIGQAGAGLSSADASRQLAAGQGFQGIGQANIQASQADLGRQLAAAQGQVGIGQARTNALGQQVGALSSLGQQFQGLGLAQQDAAINDQNAVLKAGGIQQGLTQADIDAQRNLGQTQNTAIINQIGAAGNALTSGGQGGGTSSSQTTAPGANLLGQIAGAGGALLAGSKAFSKGGKVKKSLSKVSYGNGPQRGLGMFKRAV